MTQEKRYKTALEKIWKECGKVCEEYELCHHEVCNNSVHAWFISDMALNPSKYEALEK